MSKVKEMFATDLWNEQINVRNFVQKNISPFEGDSSFLCGPTERTQKLWDLCRAAIKEETDNKSQV